MTGELYYLGMTVGAGTYISGKFIYSALETINRHSDIAEKDQLTEEDDRFLRESKESIENYLEIDKLDFVKAYLGKPEELGENWGHIIAVNELDFYDGELQYEVPGYDDEAFDELLEPQEA